MEINDQRHKAKGNSFRISRSLRLSSSLFVIPFKSKPIKVSLDAVRGMANNINQQAVLRMMEDRRSAWNEYQECRIRITISVIT